VVLLHSKWGVTHCEPGNLKRLKGQRVAVSTVLMDDLLNIVVRMLGLVQFLVAGLYCKPDILYFLSLLAFILRSAL
jgi:hypothetical protein